MNLSTPRLEPVMQLTVQVARPLEAAPAFQIGWQ